MAEAPRMYDPGEPNQGIMQAAYESAKKEIPTAYGRAKILDQKPPSKDMITEVPTQEQLEKKYGTYTHIEPPPVPPL
ncbi:hypothetical protein H0W80_02460 [Candidatus Saccharibacteria bacterium]|nr:hypothetical protein [Candidatus Saccharibacteria bacterium]